MPVPERPADWRRILLVDAAIETGLLACFARPTTPEDAARQAGLDPRASRIVATALHDAGYLTGERALRLSPTGATLVAAGDDDPAADFAFEARAMRSHLGLSETLRTGLPQDDVSGGDRVTRERFMHAMRRVAGPRAAVSARALGIPAPGARLLDVGGAPGTYARAFAAAGWQVTVLDLPATLEIGGPWLREAGIATVAGDATQELPSGPWDAVYLGNVLHLFAPAVAAALVRRAGDALPAGGLLAVQEVLGDRSPQGPSFGVMMLLSTAGGDAYPEGDHRAWMDAAGCPVEKAVSLEQAEHHLLIGRRSR